jgi:tRNA modification GTPase
MSTLNPDDTIVALSTPIGEGGIAIVRLSGARALEIADRIFAAKDGAKPSAYRSHSLHYGHIINRGKDGVIGVKKGEEGAIGVNKEQEITHDARRSAEQSGASPKGTTHDETIDEVLLTVMRAPKTYTKEDIVEINCHGGMQAAKKVLRLVAANGARIAEPGEFTKRAFLNGRLDLAQAEAVLEVIRAKAERSLEAALDQLEGALSKRIEALRAEALEVASEIEAAIDFPDEEPGAKESGALAGKAKNIIAGLKGLIDSYEEGMVLRDGILAIICGKPNVGKSSLMNLLLKRDRCIVSPIPGTTRDAVEEMINLRGIPIRLVDTAGIGKAGNTLDREGARRSKQYLKKAAMALFILDASTKIDQKDLAIARLVGKKKKIMIINKCDLRARIDKKKIKELFRDDRVIEISVKKHRGITELENAIADASLEPGSGSRREDSIVTSVRHKGLLDNSYQCMISVCKALERGVSPELIAVDLREAIESLGLITGKSVSDDILDRIFEKFCVGK